MTNTAALAWPEIDTVMLDMDGTLLDLHFDNYFWFEHLPKRFSDIHGKPLEAARRDLQHQIASIEGTLEWYCLDYWSELLELDMPALKREIRHRIAVRPFVEQFLSTLKTLNKKVILVTNSHRAGLALKLDQTGIAHHFDEIVCSHDYQTPKEQSGFWHALIHHHPFDPLKTLFIDDTDRVLQAAQAFGIAHLVGVHQPDSTQPRRLESFFAINHFDEIMP
jgi:putative hydrolase of the HAD superfamily